MRSACISNLIIVGSLSDRQILLVSSSAQRALHFWSPFQPWISDQPHAAQRNPTSPTSWFALTGVFLRLTAPLGSTIADLTSPPFLPLLLENLAQKNSAIHFTGLRDPHWPCLRPTRSLGRDGDDPHGIAGTKTTPPRFPSLCGREVPSCQQLRHMAKTHATPPYPSSTHALFHSGKLSQRLFNFITLLGVRP